MYSNTIVSRNMPELYLCYIYDKARRHDLFGVSRWSLSCGWNPRLNSADYAHCKVDVKLPYVQLRNRWKPKAFLGIYLWIMIIYNYLVTMMPLIKPNHIMLILQRACHLFTWSGSYTCKYNKDVKTIFAVCN